MSSKNNCLAGFAVLENHAMQSRGSGGYKLCSSGDLSTYFEEPENPGDPVNMITLGVGMNFGGGYDFYGTMGINGTQIRIQKQPEHTGTINYDHMQQSMERQANYQSPINVDIVESYTYMSGVSNEIGGLSSSTWSSLFYGAGVEGVSNAYQSVQGEINLQIKYNRSLNPSNQTPYLKTPKAFKLAGRYGGVPFAIWGITNTHNQYRSGEINTGWMMAEQTSNVIGVIPVIGTAWTIGWESGRLLTQMDWYKEYFKYPVQVFLGIRPKKPECMLCPK